jgi:hypothetical protein
VPSRGDRFVIAGKDLDRNVKQTASQIAGDVGSAPTKPYEFSSTLEDDGELIVLRNREGS